MGLLDTLASTLLDDDDDDKKKAGARLDPAQAAQFIQAAAGLVTKIGLPKLIELFSKSGLRDEVLSWIGKGRNLPVSGEQVQSALGPKLIGELAKKSGLDSGKAAGAMAKYLPKVVDLLTPDGEADDDKAKKAVEGFDLGDVGGLLGSLLGK